MNSDAPDVVGRRIAAIRKMRGFTQRQLATRTHLSLSLISKIEVGAKQTTASTLRVIASTLHVTVSELLGDVEASVTPDRLLQRLESVLVGQFLPTIEMQGGPRTLVLIEAGVQRAAQLRLAARYAELTDLVPSLVEELTFYAQSAKGEERERVFALLAVTYRCLDALANKTGYFGLSFLAVDRVAQFSEASHDPLMIATSAYLRGQSALDVGQYKRGLMLLDKARGVLDLERSPGVLAVSGSLHLRSAVLAAKDGNSTNAWDHIAEARKIAHRLGKDSVTCGTYFGPSNVGIHSVATAVELLDDSRAINDATSFRLTPEVPTERTSHHYADLARAYLWRGNASHALRCLLLAEDIAAHHTQHHLGARETAAALFRSARRPSDDLVGLVKRMRLTVT